MPSPWLRVASLSGATGVALGAFGAHALRPRLPVEKLASWDTAVEYQLFHSVVLLALALYGAYSTRPVTLPSALFSVGILLFSGSIYLLVLVGGAWFAPLTPLGGLCLIAGWLAIGFVLK